MIRDLSFTIAHRHPLFTSCPNCTNPNGPNDVFDPPVSTSPSMTAGKGTRRIAPWLRFSPKVSIRLEWNCPAPSRARRGPRPTFLGSSSRTRWTDPARRNTARSRERQGCTAVGKSMHQCRMCGIPCIPPRTPRRNPVHSMKSKPSDFVGFGVAVFLGVAAGDTEMPGSRLWNLGLSKSFAGTNLPDRRVLTARFPRLSSLIE